MKKIFLIICVLFHFGAAFSGTKRALIFAIANYPANHGWITPLASLNDAQQLKIVLENQGFSDNNIEIVADKEATVKGIEKAFAKLIDSAQKGDVIIVHFSCHGQRLATDDPAKLSGLDQSVVSYNAQYVSNPSQKDYDRLQGDYVRGRVIGSYLKQLRHKVGKNGDVIVFMDFCYSGGGTRGTSIVRGGNPPMVPPGYTIKSTPDKTHDLYNSNINADDGDMSTFVVFSATSPEEPDFQTSDDNKQGIGSLTYAIKKAFQNLDPANTTYRTFFARVEATMNARVPSQHPLLEGNGIDRALMGGNYISQTPYVEISKITASGQIEVKAGKVEGLDSGAVVEVDSAGTYNPANTSPIAKGTVIKAENYTATVQLDKPLNVPKSEAWVFVTSPVYKLKPISLKIVEGKAYKINGSTFTGFTTGEAQKIIATIKDEPFVTFNDFPDLLLVKGEGNTDTLLVASNCYAFAVVKNAPENAEAIYENIKSYSQYLFLSQLRLKNESISFQVKLIPVKNGKVVADSVAQMSEDGRYVFHNGDSVAIWIKNTGNTDAYINIIDMQPNGIINPILPDHNNSIYPNDLKFKAGQTHLFGPPGYFITISPPYGTELFKIFACKDEINMENVINTRAQSRGNMQALEQLVQYSYSRGAEGHKLNDEEGTTIDLPFTIAK
jgi:metacaspase-1